jgi:hypothetical protein
MFSKIRNLLSSLSARSSKAPRGRWFSQISQSHIDDEELVQEVSQNAATKHYVFRVFTDEPPKFTMGGGGLLVQSPELKVNMMIPYPEELTPLLQEKFTHWYNVYCDSLGFGPMQLVMPGQPPGERLGGVLHTYNALWVLHTIAQANRLRLSEGKILAIHGLAPTNRDEFNAQLHPLLTQADLHHIIVFSKAAVNAGRVCKDSGVPLENLPEEISRRFAATGAWKLIDVEEAAELALDLNEGHTEVCRRIFNLSDEYGEDSWAAHHPRFPKNG